MPDTRPVSVRIPLDTLTDIQKYCLKKGYGYSVAQFIREAVELRVKAERSKINAA